MPGEGDAAQAHSETGHEDRRSHVGVQIPKIQPSAVNIVKADDPGEGKRLHRLPANSRVQRDPRQYGQNAREESQTEMKRLFPAIRFPLCGQWIDRQNKAGKPWQEAAFILQVMAAVQNTGDGVPAKETG